MALHQSHPSLFQALFATLLELYSIDLARAKAVSPQTEAAFSNAESPQEENDEFFSLCDRRWLPNQRMFSINIGKRIDSAY
jgi:hypothetical protein